MRNNLSTAHVYMTAVHKVALEKAAAIDNRSLSNFLLNLGLQRAVELGVMVPGYKGPGTEETDSATQ